MVVSEDLVNVRIEEENEETNDVPAEREEKKQNFSFSEGIPTLEDNNKENENKAQSDTQKNSTETSTSDQKTSKPDFMKKLGIVKIQPSLQGSKLR